MEERPLLYFKNRQEWRAWLNDNHAKYKGVYLVFYKVNSLHESMRWEEAVQEALCFGWIDSTVKKLDEERRKQLFTPRRPQSVWSKRNKTYIADLTEQGLMHQAGLQKVTAAKKDGSWTSLDAVENLIIPNDLQAAFNQQPKAFSNYLAFSKTYRKTYLYWLHQAKRPATRTKRITEIVALCEQNKKTRN